MACTSPASASRTASCTCSPAIRPATSGGSARLVPCSLPPTTTTSASSGPRARAFSTTSGPMPRGSPRVTARRRRPALLGPDVDVGRAPQQIDVVLDRELLGELLAHAVARVFEQHLARGLPPRDLDEG